VADLRLPHRVARITDASVTRLIAKPPDWEEHHARPRRPGTRSPGRRAVGAEPERQDERKQRLETFDVGSGIHVRTLDTVFRCSSGGGSERTISVDAGSLVRASRSK
jgi:hypothetical protein